MVLRDIRSDQRLEYGDAVCLTIHALARMSEKRVLGRVGPLMAKELTRCSLLAADAVVRARGLPPSSLGRTSSGLYYRVLRGQHWFRAMRFWTRAFTLFCRAMDDVAQSVCEKRELTEHESALFEHWWSQRQDLGVPRVWDQFPRAAGRVNSELGQPDGMEDRKHLLVLYRALSEGTPGGLFRGGDGQLRLGQRQMRDAVAKGMGLSRPRAGAPTQVQLDHEVADENEQDVIDSVAAVEAVRRLREAVQTRKEVVEPDSARRHVLDHFEALLSKQMTFRELEKSVGKAKSALQRAFRAEREAVLAIAGFAEY